MEVALASGVAWTPTIGHGRASVTVDRLAQLRLSTAGDEHTRTLFSEALCSPKADAGTQAQSCVSACHSSSPLGSNVAGADVADSKDALDEAA
jgi:hypothetical protein